MRNALKILMLMLCCAQGAWAAPRELTNITVIADPALMMPLSELVRQYSTKHEVSVTLVSSEEKDPETLIGEGMEAHVLISANQELTATLQLRGLIDVFAQNPLVHTDLALVRRRAGTSDFGQWTLASLFYHDGNEMPVLILDPKQYIEGARSIAALNANNVSIDNRIVMNSKKEMIAQLKREDSIGIMLATDALLDPELNVVSVLPASQYEPVMFMALVLASESMPEARQLVKFLTDDGSEKIFTHYGFKPADAVK